MKQFSIDRRKKKFHLKDENKIMKKTWRNYVFSFESLEKIVCQKNQIFV